MIKRLLSSPAWLLRPAAAVIPLAVVLGATGGAAVHSLGVLVSHPLAAHATSVITSSAGPGAVSASTGVTGSDGVTWIAIPRGSAASRSTSQAVRAAADKFFAGSACTALIGKPGAAVGTGLADTIDQSGKTSPSPQMDIVAVGFGSSAGNFDIYVKVLDLNPMLHAANNEVDYVNAGGPGNPPPPAAIPHAPDTGVVAPANPGTANFWYVTWGDQFAVARWPLNAPLPADVTVGAPALPGATPPAQGPPPVPNIPSVPSQDSHNLSTSWYAPFAWGHTYNGISITTAPSIDPAKGYAPEASVTGGFDFARNTIHIAVPLALSGLHVGSTLTKPYAETRQYVYDTPIGRGTNYTPSSVGPGANAILKASC